MQKSWWSIHSILHTFPGVDFSRNLHADAAQIFHTAVVRQLRKGQLTHTSQCKGLHPGSEESLRAETLAICIKY